MPVKNKEHIEIRSEEVQEILSYVPIWMIRWGNTLILFIILGLLFITWFVKYPDVITTEVMITTISPPEKLYAKTSGQFEVILVKDGEEISRKQTLAIIENSAYYKDVLFLKSIIDTLKIDYKDFHFPINELPPLILGDITTSFAQFENNYSDYMLNNQLTPYMSESFANQFSLIEAKGRLMNLKDQQKLNEKELDLKAKDVARQKKLFEDGMISEKDYEQKQLEYLQSKRSYKNLEPSISQIRELISNFQKNLKSTNIKKIQDETRLLNKALQSYYLLKKAIKDWEKNFVLKSSIKGRVSFLSYYNENQSVTIGDIIFTIIPSENNSFVGKIKAPATNSGKIKQGQKVQISLLNFPATEFGKLNGKVKNISFIPDENGNYLIDVELPKELITTYNRVIDFRQEMSGSAEIITEELRLADRFFYQLRNVFQ